MFVSGQTPYSTGHQPLDNDGVKEQGVVTVGEKEYPVGEVSPDDTNAIANIIAQLDVIESLPDGGREIAACLKQQGKRIDVVVFKIDKEIQDQFSTLRALVGGLEERADVAERELHVLREETSVIQKVNKNTETRADEVEAQHLAQMGLLEGLRCTARDLESSTNGLKGDLDNFGKGLQDLEEKLNNFDTILHRKLKQTAAKCQAGIDQIQGDMTSNFKKLRGSLHNVMDRVGNVEKTVEAGSEEIKRLSAAQEVEEGKIGELVKFLEDCHKEIEKNKEEFDTLLKNYMQTALDVLDLSNADAINAKAISDEKGAREKDVLEEKAARIKLEEALKKAQEELKNQLRANAQMTLRYQFMLEINQYIEKKKSTLLGKLGVGSMIAGSVLVGSGLLELEKGLQERGGLMTQADGLATVTGEIQNNPVDFVGRGTSFPALKEQQNVNHATAQGFGIIAKGFSERAAAIYSNLNIDLIKVIGGLVAIGGGVILGAEQIYLNNKAAELNKKILAVAERRFDRYIAKHPEVLDGDPAALNKLLKYTLPVLDKLK